MHDGFRRESQHHQSGDGQRAHGHGRPVKQHAQQHDGDHDEGTLRRHLIAGENEIEPSNEKRGERRPFFDRRTVGESRDQREEGAENEKYRAGHHRHVIARDRQHVANAGNKQRVIDVWRNGVAPAVDQHRRNGAFVARKYGAYARIDSIAQPLNEGVSALENSLRGRGGHFDGAAHEAGGANALEKYIAREIVTARLDRLQRRIERGFGFDERSGRWRHAALDQKPHAPRRFLDPAAVDAVDTEHEAVGVLALLAQFDKAGHRHTRGREAQHLLIDERGFQRRNGKAQSDAEQPERDHVWHDLPAQQ
jgi:hypothetical protein